ncbi:MAG: DNA cytosine methyltransferase [Stackebrandtia sp.]
MTLTFTDIFCGAGGSSIGLAAAGFELRLAANHWQRAVETHSSNFRDADHLCADVNNYDMRRLPRTDVLWASPICTEASPAGGRRRSKKPAAGQLDLLADGAVEQAGFTRTRATFHDVIRATEVHRYTAVLVENVVEVAWDWELFDWWVDGMCRLGYDVQFVSVSSAHVGGPGNPYAPQWRDRLYLVFTRTGVPLPDVAPRPLARCRDCDQDVHAVQSWKPDVRSYGPRRAPVGKYRAQYVYRCPNTRCRHALVEPYVLPAAAVIDWSNTGARIGDRARPLAASTMARIRAGLEMYAEPAIVRSCGADNPGTEHMRVRPAAGDALGTQLTSGSHALLVPVGGTWNDTAYPTGLPMRTRTANPKGYESIVVPPGAFVVKNYTPRGSHRQMVKDATTEPLGALTLQDHHGLVIPYRKGKAKRASEPLHTLSTIDSAGVLRPAVDPLDCHYRMLQPREQLRAQRFPDTYLVTGNKGEQTMQAGAAVSSNVAQWLGQRVAAALGDGR